MEVGGLEWLQEPFQPRSSGSSGLYFFFGSGENWEDLSSLERQNEFKATQILGFSSWGNFFLAPDFELHLNFQFYIIQKNGPYPPTKNSTRWTFRDFVCILLSLELSVTFSNMKRHVFFWQCVGSGSWKNDTPQAEERFVDFAECLVTSNFRRKFW